MRAPAEIAIEQLDPAEVVADHVAEIARVWTWTTEGRARETLRRHAVRDGFRFLAARAPDGSLAGFVYGYRGAPGQWWHDHVARALGRERGSRWLAPGYFEFAELHVRPDAQGRGIGGRLHDAVLVGLPSRTAVLTPQRDNERALSLYRSRGWQLIHDALVFDSGTRYCVLGLDLAPE